MNCPICKNKASLIDNNFPGYLEGTVFDIFECSRCKTSFINTSKIDKNIYNLIYKKNNLPGYARYADCVKNIKSKSNPLKFLAKQELTYRLVYEFLKNKNKLDILDMGCGHGYLVHALRKKDHNAYGLDVSKNAINSAKSNFGEYYFNCDLKDFKPNKKYDLITATELIEHLDNPKEFIKNCLKLLKDNGNLIITTPNKNFVKNSIWKTDLPPVHTFLFSKKSFNFLTEDLNAQVDFFNFNKFIEKGDNKLAQLFVLNKKNKPLAILNKDGNLSKERVDDIDNFLKKIIKIIIYSTPITYLSNLVKNIFHKEDLTLGIIIRKK